jgi:ABC-type nitrate/sulfonate/bicarbonate transport system substrate-binding protein
MDVGRKREGTVPEILRLLCLTALSLMLAGAGSGLAQTKPANVKIVYPAPSSTSWPLWIAKEAGIFERNGLNATVEFAMHPAGPAAVISGEALTHNLGLDTAMLAGMRGDQVVIVGSPLLVGQFALVGAKGIADAKQLERKRIAIGRIGDPPYFYALGVLNALKIDTKGLQWIPAGTPPQRALALRNGMADAAMLTSPDYYILEDEGYAVLARLQEFRQIPIATSYMFRRRVVIETPHLVEALLKSHIEAVKRFYDDKPFVLGLLKTYLKADEKILERLYAETVEAQVFERVPYVTRTTLTGIIERGKAETPELATFDFRRTIDQSVIDRLADQGFFEKVFGPGIKDEVAAKRAQSFR